MSDNAVALRPTETSVMERGTMSPASVLAHVAKVQEIMQTLLKSGEHYGVIPGTDKPTLLKPGAEKLSFTFRLLPKFRITKTDLPGGHREYELVCELWHESGVFAGEGVGSCSTMESKYRYRNAAKKCPNCGKETIIKGKEQYGGGWLCFAKKGGCGSKYPDNAPEIVNQVVGKVENPDVADVYNTVLKMAKKRALVDATITACAASDIFTQDVEDMMPEQDKPVDNSMADTVDKAMEEIKAARPPVAPDGDNPADQRRNLEAECLRLATMLGGDTLSATKNGLQDLRSEVQTNAVTYDDYMGKLRGLRDMLTERATKQGVLDL